MAVGEEPETVETVAEPFLVREGLVARTARGRVATAAGYAHLGLRVPRTGHPAATQAVLPLEDDPAAQG